jgi:hypothetical protein
MSDNDAISSLTVTNLDNLNTIVLKQSGKRIFISTKDSIVIDIAGLDFILRTLIMKDIIHPSLLERILDEYNSTRKS